MAIIVSEKAEAQLDAMDNELRIKFIKHMDKIQVMPPRRHLQYGLPFNIEDVTRQARLVYSIQDKNITVVRCFATHKDYEKWFKSFK